MITLNELLNDVFANMDAYVRYPKTNPELASTGLKHIIKSPHNLYTVHDEDNAVTNNILEVVYTPFKRSDVHVSVDGDVLTVKIGTEETEQQEEAGLVYRGISKQTREFSLKLPKSVDVNHITAKTEDGILRITMPHMKEEKTVREITID